MDVTPRLLLWLIQQRLHNNEYAHPAIVSCKPPFSMLQLDTLDISHLDIPDLVNLFLFPWFELRGPDLISTIRFGWMLDVLICVI